MIVGKLPASSAPLRPRFRGLRSLRPRRLEDRVSYCAYTSTAPTNDLTYLTLIWRRAKTRALGEAFTRLKRIRSTHSEQRGRTLQSNRNNCRDDSAHLLWRTTCDARTLHQVKCDFPAVQKSGPPIDLASNTHTCRNDSHRQPRTQTPSPTTTARAPSHSASSREHPPPWPTLNPPRPSTRSLSRLAQRRRQLACAMSFPVSKPPTSKSSRREASGYTYDVWSAMIKEK
jgi:hypothetical protein